MTGRVVHITGGDSVPLSDQWAVLHAITVAGGSPVDSQRTDRAGRYVLRPSVADSVAHYLVSVRYDGIAYFTEPLSPSGAYTDTAEILLVYDTSSTDPPIGLAERHVVIRAPESDGGRRVIELLVLVNRGGLTRIAPDTNQPVWQGAIPDGAVQFEVGASDVSGQAIYRRGNTVAVAAPVPPGERQILVSYLIPASSRQLTIPVDQDVGRLNVLIEDTAATLVYPTLEPRGREELEGRPFRRFGRDGVPAGTPLSVRFGAAPLSVAEFWWVLVPIVALTLMGAFVWWWRQVPVRSEANDPKTLAAQIAALDAAFAGRETEAYRRRRALLEEQLAAALAGHEETG